MQRQRLQRQRLQWQLLVQAADAVAVAVAAAVVAAAALGRRCGGLEAAMVVSDSASWWLVAVLEHSRAGTGICTATHHAAGVCMAGGGAHVFAVGMGGGGGADCSTASLVNRGGAAAHTMAAAATQLAPPMAGSPEARPTVALHLNFSVSVASQFCKQSARPYHRYHCASMS